MALAMAMSPSPALATMMEAMASGTDVPTASTTTPMMKASMPQRHPMAVARFAMAAQQTPSQTMHMIKVPQYHFLKRSVLQSGIVTTKAALNGTERMKKNWSIGESGHSHRDSSSSSS